MKCLVPAVLLALPVLHQSAAAQARAPALDYGNGPQTALNECAAADFRAADARLNAAYRAITRRLTDDPARRSLVEAQRAWIRFRDAECEFDTKGYEGGSIRPMLFSECQERVTEQRTADLNAYLSCNRDGCAVPPTR
jgi:uncharacterized protein YecT (DUF1311 family)